MNIIAPADGNHDFQAGDAVIVLYQGRYNGIPGHFVGLRQDINWADVKESDGSVRAHPVLWLSPVASPDVTELRLG